VLIDQVLDDVAPAPPIRPRGRRRLAVVLVAFLAAVMMLVGPSTTQDAARAYVPPPVVTLGEFVLPRVVTGAAAPLLFSPAGGALFVGGTIAFIALGGDEWIADLSADFACMLRGCNDGPVVGTGGPAEHQTYPSPYMRISFSVTAGIAPHQLALTGYNCEQVRAPINGQTDCSVAGINFVSSGQQFFQARCERSEGGTYPDGPRAIGSSGGTHSVARYPGRSSADGGTDNATVDNWKTGASFGTSFSVCAPGDRVSRIEWWQGPLNASAKYQHPKGSWSSGEAVPIVTRIDTTCQRPDGSTYVRQGPQIRTDVADPTVGIGSSGCLPGDLPIGSEVFSAPEGMPPVSVSKVGGAGSPVPSVQAREDYSDCFDTIGKSKCSTDVFIDGVKCTIGNADCIRWATLVTSEPNRVQCKWGTYVVPIDSCDPLRDIYRSGAVAPSPTNQEQWVGIDPGTGQPLPGGPETPWENPNQPGTGTNTGTVPGSGTNPGSDPSPGGSSGQGCWGSGWSWNPISWVYVPVKCVLQWAFMPNPSTLNQTMTGVGNTFGGTIVGEWFSGIVEISEGVAAGPAGGGCAGPALTVSMGLVGGGTSTMHPFSACDAPMSTVATIVRTALMVGVWLGVAFLCVRMLASTIGLDLGAWGRSRTDDDS
jgi:hypothetical protein